MKKLKLLFGFLAVSLLAGIVMYSCQSDGNDAYYFGEEELTAADLFVASEAYQHMRSQLQKDSRATAAVLSGLSDSDRAEFRRLSDLISHENGPEVIGDAVAQLSELLGFDYQAKASWRSALIRDTYAGKEFTRLEIIQAQQKYQMSMVTISTRQTPEEQAEREREENYSKCVSECERINEEAACRREDEHDHELCAIMEERENQKCLDDCERLYGK